MIEPKIKPVSVLVTFARSKTKQMELLQKLTSKEITCTCNLKIRRKGEICGNCNKLKEAEERYPQHATDKALEQFVT